MDDLKHAQKERNKNILEKVEIEEKMRSNHDKHKASLQ